MMEFRPLQGPFGVEVIGVDLSVPLLPEQIRRLMVAFHENALMVIRGQSLTPEQFARYGACFGKPHNPQSYGSGRHLDGHPTLDLLTNDPALRSLLSANNADHWHADLAFEDEVGSATSVYCLEMMAQGGSTTVADMRLAYDGLDEAMKKRLENLVGIHRHRNAWDKRKVELEMRDATPEKLEAMRGRQEKHARHPVAWPQPWTGRKALYGVVGTLQAIEGMPDDEAADLLAELQEHATRPEYCMSVDYEIGTVASWDGRATLHRAPPLPAGVDSATRRTMWRAAVTGPSPYLAS